VADVRRLPGPVAERWDWQLGGLCRQLDSTMFFTPDRERGSLRTRREQRAKAVCARCPVLEQCRSHALRAREPYGVWGGMTEHERKLRLRGVAEVA